MNDPETRKVMKILILADVESKYLWDYFDKEKLEGIDLILSAGDLKPQYLSFLASFSKVPILYIRGNHDDCYENTPPDGCICIEDKIYVYKGVRIMGLGGSVRYKKGINQYTQMQMKHRINKMWLSIKKNRGFDIHILRHRELMMERIMYTRDLKRLIIYLIHISLSILYMDMYIRPISQNLPGKLSTIIRLL